MESVGAICEGEWNGMCSDEADFMEQLLGNCSLPGAAAVSCFWPGNESNVKNDHGVEAESSMTNNASKFSFSLGNTNNIFPSNFVNNNSLMAMDYCVNMELGDHGFLNDSDESQEKLFKEDDKISSSPAYEISNKRPRIPAQLLSQRRKRSKKCAKVDENENVVLHRQSSSGCYSEDDSNEANGMNSSSSSKRSSTGNGKPRATRGSATDPQSLYARKRRERINERLKVLQSLVPNGTKVDISTMLEEAVQYVNFLQLQIKLLSSDDLWMYSPIAYNGMDLGLDLKFPSLKPQS